MNDTLREACTKVFAMVDVKERGSISRDELLLGLRLLNCNPVDSEISQRLHNSATELNFEGFLRFVSETIHLTSTKDQKSEIRQALALFDTSNTGTIDKRLFVSILAHLGEMRVDEKEALTWANTLDTHGDGQLRIAELEELFVNDEDVHTTLNGTQQWEIV
ncbi:myosin regulatory light chain-like isoform X3 [Dreissena polymorpha]|uniref:myosin regulatory light chain-like isoform X3 n=1 Tax=Dreissena polymorpha TaxID=45954 RepID=UPI002264E42A|nr:myosin regulatory light chain-like isoform X3 [Dreissena polymorpha]